MTPIKWKSGDRIIPDFGEVTTGTEISLPDNLAKKFVEQGEADFVTADVTEEVEVVRATPKKVRKIEEVSPK
jgi:hypothetical protein